MHPLVAKQAGDVRQAAEQLGEIHYPTDPDATAVAMTFVWALRGEAPSTEVPLEDLVADDVLEYWRGVFADDEVREGLVRSLANYWLTYPRVRPDGDGGLVIALAWVHPDQEEPLLIDQPRQMLMHWVHLRRDPGAGEWRVSKIE